MMNENIEAKEIKEQEAEEVVGGLGRVIRPGRLFPTDLVPPEKKDDDDGSGGATGGW